MPNIHCEKKCFNPSSAPHSPSFPLHLVNVRENQKGKIEKTGQSHGCKQSNPKNPMTHAMGRQVFSQESRFPWHAAVIQENKHHHPTVPSFPSPLASQGEHDIVGCGIFLWSVPVSCPSCFPPHLLAHSQISHLWMG